MEFNHVHQWRSHPVGHSQGRERSPNRCVLDTGDRRRRRGRNSDARVVTFAIGSYADRYTFSHSNSDCHTYTDLDSAIGSYADRYTSSHSNSDCHTYTDLDSAAGSYAGAERKSNPSSDRGQDLLCSAERERLGQRAINYFGLADDA
jgi:hypothetical protein